MQGLDNAQPPTTAPQAYRTSDEQVEDTWWHGSGPMSDVARLIDRVADCDVTVLIRGESGVGKELVARAIHRRSPRARRPLVRTNCAALPAELLESELFGHERGAFTGATSVRVGMFEQAHLGTILLDEIGEMSAGLQAKLLHVLQDGSFSRLGSNRQVVADARVLAATNRDLTAMIAVGQFREDLYYRLNVVEVHVPPLRERQEELASLVPHFLGQFSAKYNRPVPAIPDDLSRLLLEYSWPGNVRELENCMKRLVLLQDPGQIERDLRTSRRAAAETAPSAAPTPLARVTEEPAPEVARKPCGVPNAERRVVACAPPVAPSGVRSLRDVAREASERAERNAIQRTLLSVRWNRHRAAERLGVSYKTLLNKIRDLAIETTVEVFDGPDRGLLPVADPAGPRVAIAVSSP
ncbi:MAG: hypothetical protein EHM24_16000 [Acidobacteria bacterium]|nr:MAG: hypothetical protein EHM24_16000 [Acidobacteriota bacterium]